MQAMQKKNRQNNTLTDNVIHFLLFVLSSPSTQRLGLSDYIADEVRKWEEEKEVGGKEATQKQTTFLAARAQRDARVGRLGSERVQKEPLSPLG